MSRINVTKTFMPPIEEYSEYLEKIWVDGILTNQGPLLVELEDSLKDYLQVQNFHFVTNGTLALQIALRAMNITGGEVITTPFSYVATTSSILWEHCIPVFVDIDPVTYCMDPDKIEAAITKNTKAIMPVHVFGQPCEIEKIDALGAKHNLKVIYDGAHAFGAKYKGKSMLSYGDISMGSFHATKLFHTIEGGCIIVNHDKELSDKIELIKHFGHEGDHHQMPGMNAKASEFQAAMGLCNLKYLDEIIAARRDISDLYDKLLKGRFQTFAANKDLTQNYAYYPVLFKNESQLLDIFAKLNAENIFPRRYFYPSLNGLKYVNGTPCPIAEDISLRIACLPLYVGLKPEDVEKIAGIVNGF